MPHLPLHKCNYAGCTQYVSDRYCEKHKHEVHLQEKIKDRQRGTAQERGYNVRWQKASKMYLREHPICECKDCIAKHRLKTANVVHHIIPHRGNYDLFWDVSNWMAMNKQCHDKHTYAETRGQA